MTTLAKEAVTCGACGRVSSHTIIHSSNTLGTPDLDLRPAPMLRDTIAHWVQECPSCGACAASLEKLTQSQRSQIASAREAESQPDMPALAFRFAVWSRLADAMKRPYEQANALLNAAWACDDAGEDTWASRFRSRAASMLLELKGEGTFERQLQVVDLYRRTRQFAEATKVGKQLLREQLPDTLAGIARYQLRKCEERDDRRYTVTDTLSAETIARQEQHRRETFKKATQDWTDQMAVVNAELISRANALFESLDATKRPCDHCKTPASQSGYRLSVGATGAVICRTCGWPQQL